MWKLKKVCECPVPSKCAHGYYFHEHLFGKLRRVPIDKHLKAIGDTRRLRKQAECEPFGEPIRAILLAHKGEYVAPVGAQASAEPATPDGKAAITVADLVRKWARDFESNSGIDTWANDVGQMNRFAACRLDVLDMDADERPAAPAAATIGSLLVTAITGAVISAFYAAARTWAPANSSRKKYRYNLRRLFDFAVARKFLVASPFTKGLTLAAGPDFQRTRRVHPAEESNIRQAARECRTAFEGQRLDDLIAVAIRTGARLGEILAWHPCDVDFEDGETGVLKVPAKELGARKMRAARKIPIDAIEVRAILERRLVGPDGKPWADAEGVFLFGNEIGEYMGAPDKAHTTAVLRAHNKIPTWTDTALSTQARAAFAKIDLEFRDYRHECAWRWHEAGKPVATIAKILGHKDVGRLATYLGATMDDAISSFHAAGKPTKPAPPTANRSKTDQKGRSFGIVRGRKVG